MLPACFRGLINILDEQAGRSTTLIERGVVLYLFQLEMRLICAVGSGFIPDRYIKFGYEVNPDPTTARQTLISIISISNGYYT